jgi:hypothetical protein
MNPQITPPPQGGYAYPCPVCHQQAAFDEDVKGHAPGKVAGWISGALVVIYGIIGVPASKSGVFLGLGAIIILVTSLAGKSSVGTTRKCQSCGHAWRVS